MDLLRLIAQGQRRLVPSGSVVERAVRSGIWQGGMNTLNRIIQLGKVVILARLLPPEEFGLLGIGFLVLAVFEHFSQLGIDQALIQRKEKQIDQYLNTVWVLQIGRGLLLTGILFFLAPIAASWFGEPRATNVIRVLGIGPLLLGLKNPGVIYFKKNLEYHWQFAQILSGTVANFVVAVVLGMILGNVWALVAGSFVGNLVSLLVSYILHEYRPQLAFDLERATELIDYGKWIFGSSIATFLGNQGDDIFVGWFFGTAPLAFYQMGYRFSNAPATEVASVIAAVSFPTLSQIQDDYVKLRKGYFRTLRLTTFFSFPTAVGIVVVSPTFVRVFLGADWLPTVPLMQALALWGIIRAMGQANIPVYKTLSRPDIGTKTSAIRVGFIALLIYPAATRFGLLGVATVIVGAAAVTLPITSFVALRLINGSVVRYVRVHIHPIIGSAIMGGAVWAIQRSLPAELLFIRFFMLVVVGVSVYGLYTVVAISLLNYRIADELRIIRRAFRS